MHLQICNLKEHTCKESISITMNATQVPSDSEWANNQHHKHSKRHVSGACVMSHLLKWTKIQMKKQSLDSIAKADLPVYHERLRLYYLAGFIPHSELSHFNMYQSKNLVLKKAL